MIVVYIIAYLLCAASMLTLITVGVPAVAVVMMAVGWCGGLLFYILTAHFFARQQT